MTGKIKKIDLTQLCIPAQDIRDIVSHVLFRGDKEGFLASLENARFEEGRGPEEKRGFEAVREKVLSGILPDLTGNDYLVLTPYLVAALGNDFLDVYAVVMETRLKNSLSHLSEGIISHREEKEQLVAKKIGLYVKQLNRELLLKWVLFLDHLPTVSRDETEEQMVRESAERIIDFFEKTTVGEETLQARDWKILMNIVRYFGASRFFLKDSKLPAGSYFGIIPYALDSLLFGLSQSTREDFMKKSVVEKLSMVRPPVIQKEEVRPFLLNSKDNFMVLSVIEAYYRRLQQDMMGRRDVFRIFSIYYEAVADAVRKCRSGDDRMLREEYLDSIYYAMNFEDFRSLGMQGDEGELHTTEKWMRKMTAEHLGLTMHPLFLMPVRNLQIALSKRQVEAWVPLPGEEPREEAQGKGSDQSALAVEEVLPGGAQEQEGIPEEAEVFAGAKTLEAEVPSAPPSAPVSGEVQEMAGEGTDEQGKSAAPVLKPEVIRKNRESHVLPINPANIMAMLIGNQPPGNFHKEEEEQEGDE